MHRKDVFVIFVMLAVAIILFPSAQGQGHTMQVRLTINNTGNTVYIPGVGEAPAGSLGSATYDNPPHYYLASYSGSYLTGLVAYAGNSISVSSTASSHTLGVDQDIGISTMLVFSQGNWSNIEKVILPVESGSFMKNPSPSFGFGLGTYYPVTVLLRYTDIDIAGSLDQSKGMLKLTIENMGVSGGKPVIEIRKS